MPLVFSYGSLQNEDVQLATFGRRLTGAFDELHGYEIAHVPILDPVVARQLGTSYYTNVVPSSDVARLVRGRVLELSDAELMLADRYEAGARYVRESLILASGARAWVYRHTLVEPRS